MQFGLSPDYGRILSGLSAGEDAIIAALDGTHDLAALGTIAAEHQVPRSRLDQLLALLLKADLLLHDPPANRAELQILGTQRAEELEPDTQAWSLVHRGHVDGQRLVACRSQRRVLIDGANRLGGTLVNLLRAAGVGTVQVHDFAPVRPMDLSPGGHQECHLGFPRQVSSGGVTAPSQAAPDLVVLVRDDHVATALGDDLVTAALPHLAVTCQPDQVIVGPLVLPGQTPCLRCIALHRTDRDPAWPQLAAQLSADSGQSRPRGEVASSAAAAGLAALQALTQLDGQRIPASVGRTLEFTLPDGLVFPRRWPVHQKCDCGSGHRMLR